MKIEKISDNQVRFTLTRDDLAARQIQLSELAYGTDKAKDLFREMLQQAAIQVGFEAENIPLMIEAVPLQGGTIVLIVTKVENPEELDTRFSNFAPSIGQQGKAASAFEQLLHSLTGHAGESSCNESAPAVSHNHSSEEAKAALRQFREYALCNRLYCFRDMDQVLKAAKRIQGRYTADSLLFGESGNYQLLLKMKDVDEVTAMRGPLSVLSEFGTLQPITYGREQYLEEHGDLLIPDHAIEKLAAFA